MKKCIIILCALMSGLVNGQELTNFYLEPGTTNNEVILHTSFFHLASATLYSSEIEIIGNRINFSICYNLGWQQVETNDDQEFLINLPTGYSDFDLTVTLAVYEDNWGYCDYVNTFDTGTVLFGYPYLPTDKTFVPDDNFEAYLESIGLGDDILENDNVYTHRFINVGRLNLQVKEIQDLTGIEILSRLDVLNIYFNLITEFDSTNHPTLWKLWAFNNPLTFLDFSQNPMLRDLLLNDNNLTYLNLRNGNNESFDDLYVGESPDLTCISVDDPNLAPYPNWGVSIPNVVYSEDCSLGVNDNEALQAVVYPNPVQEFLTIEGIEKIENIAVYSMSGELIALEKNTNQIDFSTHPNGVYFVKIETEKGSVFQKVLKE